MDSKIKKELQRDLRDWLGKEWKSLSHQEREDITDAYYELTKSRDVDALETIHRISDKEFNYGILVIGSLYGIGLSMLADLLGGILRDSLGEKFYFAVVVMLFTGLTAALVSLFKSASRGDAKHWNLLKALQAEASRLKAVAILDEDRDVAGLEIDFPQSNPSSDE